MTNHLPKGWFFSDEGIRLVAEALNKDGGPNHRPIVDSYGRAKIGAWRIALALAASGGDPPAGKCDLPALGWVCTRDKGHDGPCAAVPAIAQRLDGAQLQKDTKDKERGHCAE